jgi:hypothetical protein
VYQWLVEPFPGTSRQRLFTQWRDYNIRLSTFTGSVALTQWLDGSFASLKANPGDIDLVTFIPYTIYEPITEPLIDFYSTFSLYERGLDAYICPVYAIGHLKYDLFSERRAYWQKLFGSRKDDLGRKGFLEITV